MKKININKKSFSGLIIVFTMITGLVIQSCQVEDDVFENNNPELALKNFEELAKKTLPKIKIIKGRFLSKSENSSFNKINQNMLNEEIKKELMPLVNSSRKLFNSYGISDNDLKGTFKDLNNPNIAVLGLVILASNKNNISRKNGGSSLFSKSMNEKDVWDCLLRATGISGLSNIFRNGLAFTLRYEGKKYVLRVISKALGRTLGWVGAAYAMYDFGDCMGWY